MARTAQTITKVGNVQLDTSRRKFGYTSALFDGTGDYLYTNNDFSTQIGTGACTWECFFQVDVDAGNGTVVVMSNRLGGTSNGEVQMLFRNFDMKVQVNGYGTGAFNANGVGPALGTDAWHHFVWARNASGTWAIWVNGSRVANGTGYTQSLAAQGIGIGSTPDGQIPINSGTNGWIDEVRISTVDRYGVGNTSITVPTAPHTNDDNTILLMHMEDVTDGSTTFEDDVEDRLAVNLIPYGNTQVSTTQSQFGGASARLDGTDDFLIMPGAYFDASADFTLEAWVRPDNVDASGKAIFDFRGLDTAYGGTGFSGGVTGNVILIDCDSFGIFRVYLDGSNRSTGGTNTFAANTWHHLAMQRSSGVINVWLNGTRYVNYTTSTDYTSRFGNIQPIGITGNLSNDFPGYIDEIRISKVARYTNGATITVPTSAFSNDADTVMLIHADGANGSTVFDDDLSPAGVTHEGAATLSASATMTVAAGKVHDATVNLSGVWTASIQATASVNGSIDMAGVFALSSEGARTRATDVTLSTIINLSLQGDKIAGTSASISSVVSLTSTAARTRDANSSLAVSASLTATPNRIQQGAATFSGVFTPTITAVASLNGSIDMFAQATATATGLRIQSSSASLSSAFATQATGGYLLTTDASASVTATQTATAIEWQRNTIGNRPRDWTTETGTPSIVTSTSSIGAGSLQVDSGDKLYISASNDFQNIATVDFRVKLPTQASQDINNKAVMFFNIGQLTPGSTDSFAIHTVNVTQDGEGNSRFRFRITQNGEFVDDPDDDVRSWTSDVILQNDWSDWVHVRCEMDSSGWHVWFDGTKQTPSSNDSIGEITTVQTANNPRIGGQYFSVPAVTFWIDELLISEDLLVSTATSSFTVPTAAYKGNDTIDQDNTLGLWHFDTNVFDDMSGFNLTGSATLSSAATVTAGISGLQNASATLSATATASATPTKIKGAVATLSATATVSATVGVIEQFNSALSGLFSLTATVGRIQQGATSLQATFTQNAAVNVVVGATTSQSATATLNSTATRIKQFDATLSGFAATLVAAAKIGDYLVDIPVTATLGATATKTTDVVATPSATVTLSGTALRIKALDSAISTTATLSTDVNVVQSAGASLSTAATVSADVNELQGISATISAVASATATANVFTGNQVLADVTATLSADFVRTRDTSSSVVVTATLGSQPVKTANVLADLTSQGGFTVTADVSVQGEITASVQASLTATTQITAQGASALATTGTLSTTVSKTSETSATLATTAGLSGIGGALAATSMSAAVAATLVVRGGVIHVGRYVYTVPAETRRFTIHRETRTYTIGDT